MSKSGLDTRWERYGRGLMMEESYLVIWDLVVKSRDLMERSTSMQPKYCNKKAERPDKQRDILFIISLIIVQNTYEGKAQDMEEFKGVGS